jgi:SAM-dependent methyltransferase
VEGEAVKFIDENARIESALKGEALYGDDFSAEEIEGWFKDEEEGYFNLYYGAGAGEDNKVELRSGQYEYASLAAEHAFRWIPDKPYPNVLGVGCAHGLELRPVLPKSSSITILEPSDGFVATEIDGKPVEYVKPNASGIMPFDDAIFDIIICFSVLHHIPNLSTVLAEMLRVLKPGGYVLLREPTHSMGDWRKPRRGLTKRERGIPLKIFREIILKSGFRIERESQCVFSLMPKLSPLFDGSIWVRNWIVQVDRILCLLPIWQKKYHATKWWHKFRPTAASFVLTK